MQNLKVIFEDENLLVVDKPPGLVVERAETVKEKTLADVLQKDFGIKIFRAGIVHRLDKDTSGIILIAKTTKAFENLQSQFAKRLVRKQYLALVHGIIGDSGKVEGDIARNPKNREKFNVIAGGKEAITEYEPIESLVMSSDFIEKIFHEFNKIKFRKLQTTNYQLYTLVSCRPLTGRTHQIRVHLKYVNHPIVSDEKYVGRKMYRLDRRWCPRMFLHAKKIGFYHPESGKWMELESELPNDLKNSLALLTEI